MIHPSTYLCCIPFAFEIDPLLVVVEGGGEGSHRRLQSRLQVVSLGLVQLDWVELTKD